MEENDSVVLEQLSLRQVLIEKVLKIPQYQRIYCWGEKNVIRLLDDLFNIDKPYCIGSIILQLKGSNVYDIIDGQQRLVTLSLLLLQLNIGEYVSLLDEKFNDSEAQRYICYNKFLINQYVSRNGFSKVEKLLELVKFNVLILKDGSIDLAYTFFSNQNSRGASLTDYDLLKAHHLRYVVTEPQQLHLSSRWDTIISSEQKEHEQALALYIFRLRKWLNFDWWNESEKFYVKKEYESAPVISSIPPFGEKFSYSEPIQGGTHFFEFTNKAIERMRLFKNTEEFKMIHKLQGESHFYYRDVIEALIFAYYMKFGESYLTEAMLLITRYVSQYRYENKRFNQNGLFEHIRLSKIPLIIELYTSPTFFLADLYNRNVNLMSLKQIKSEQKRDTRSDIRVRYNAKLRTCFESINDEQLTLSNLNIWK